ncbi:MAG: hypothetical protein EPO22_09290 [Dehalococcoidia bacterium]|nr:MAG: hypothetical protein EPO22_09290 [Dehalococcoidia bacterium]
MISTRIGVAFALLLAVGGIAIGTTAFFAAERKTGDITGRLVQSRATNEYDGPPLAFPLDEFFIGRGSDGVLHAFYAYPPGYFGHVRGCKVVWDAAAATVATPPAGVGATPAAGPGLYVDPCGGARFSRDGTLVSGPADRNLDYFATSAGVEGMIVDTRQLYCGSAVTPLETPIAGEPSSTPTSTPGQPEKCERVSPNTKRP